MTSDLYEYGPTGAREPDRSMLRRLGLATGPYVRGWTHLGTVTTYDPAEDGEPGPATTVTVEVNAMPAVFWRFTIENPADSPGETFEVTTGSGGLSKYWRSVMLVASGMLWVGVKGEDEG